MKKHLFLYVMTLIGVMVVASTATAKDRLWMAKAAARVNANHQMDAGKAFRFSSADQLAGERLWMARENAVDKLDKSGADLDIAGSQRMKSPGSISNKTKSWLVCEKSIPGFRLFFKGGGHVSTEREKCG